MNFTEWALSRALLVVLMFFGIAAIDVPSNPALRLVHQILDRFRDAVETLPVDVF